MMDQTLSYPTFASDFDQQGPNFEDFAISNVPTHQGQPVLPSGINTFRPSSFTNSLSQPGSSLHTPSSSQSFQSHNRNFVAPVAFPGMQYASTSAIDPTDSAGMNTAGPSTYAQPGAYNSGQGGRQMSGGFEASFLDQEDQGDRDDDEQYKQEIDEGAEQGEQLVEGQGEDDEEPLYVNAKQYHRILKRRIARQRLEELNRLSRSRKPYLHESRHRHACSRPRGKGGRFLTAEEIEALKKEEAAKEAAGSPQTASSA